MSRNCRGRGSNKRKRRESTITSDNNEDQIQVPEPEPESESESESEQQQQQQETEHNHNSNTNPNPGTSSSNSNSNSNLDSTSIDNFDAGIHTEHNLTKLISELLTYTTISFLMYELKLLAMDVSVFTRASKKVRGMLIYLATAVRVSKLALLVGENLLASTVCTFRFLYYRGIDYWINNSTFNSTCFTLSLLLGIPLGEFKVIDGNSFPKFRGPLTLHTTQGDIHGFSDDLGVQVPPVANIQGFTWDNCVGTVIFEKESTFIYACQHFKDKSWLLIQGGGMPSRNFQSFLTCLNMNASQLLFYILTDCDEAGFRLGQLYLNLLPQGKRMGLNVDDFESVLSAQILVEKERQKVSTTLATHTLAPSIRQELENLLACGYKAHTDSIYDIDGYIRNKLQNEATE